MSRVTRNPATVYAAVARIDMKIAENFTVFPINVSFGRGVTSDGALDPGFWFGHFASSAEAATISIPTYEKVEMDIPILVIP
jgi:hypothetical protein